MRQDTIDIYTTSTPRDDPTDSDGELGAGGKPSTWLPPGKLADLLNSYTVHVLSPHTQVIFWCVPTLPYARGDFRTLCNLLSRSLVLPIATLLFFCA